MHARLDHWRDHITTTLNSPETEALIIDVLIDINGGIVVHKGSAPVTDVAAEEGHDAAALDECLDVCAHVLAPVFVMPYTEQQLITCEEVLRVFVDVKIGAVVCQVAKLFEP